MKRKSLFNRIISLSIATVLFLTSSASAFADVEDISTDVEITEIKEAVDESMPAEDESTQVAEGLTPAQEDENSESPPATEEKPEGVADKVQEIVKEIIDTIIPDDSEDPESSEANEETAESEDENLEEAEESEEGEETECEHEYIYTPNEDGTHLVKCSKCDIEEFTESCEFNEDGICIYCGYKRLPEPILVYEDEEVIVTVKGAVPENADLKVTPIKKDLEETKEAYESVEATLKEESLDKDYVIKGFLAYDIFFTDIETHNEVEPDGDVTVSLQYKGEQIPQEAIEQEENATQNILVNHFNEVTNSIEELKEAGKAELNVTDSNAITAAEFTSDSFSKYVITWVQTSARTVKINLVNRLEDGTELTPGDNARTLNPPTDNTEVNHNIAEFVSENPIDGYTFVNAKYQGTVIKRVTIKYNNPNYTVTFYKNDYTNSNSNNSSNRVAQFTTSNTSNTIEKDIDLYYKADTRLIITNIATGDASENAGTIYEYQIVDSNNAPLANCLYESDKNSATNLKTDSQGILHIAPNESVRFHNLPDGEYTITETKIEGEYSFSDFVVKVYESGNERAVYDITTNQPRKISVTLSKSNIPSVKFKNCLATITETPVLNREISKYINYKPDENNNDIYDLSIKFVGPEERIVTTINEQESYDIHTKKNVDIVLAIDKSNSMNGSNLTYVRNAIANMVTVFEGKTDVDAKWKVVDFGTDAALVSGAWINTEDVNAAFTTNLRGGTNYQAGLEKANAELHQGGRADAEKIIIFLTDGEPTYHGNGEGLGNRLSEETYSATMTAAAGVQCDQFYAVGMNLGTVPVYDYIETEERYWFFGWHTRKVWDWVEVRTIRGYNLLEELASKVQATKKEAEDVAADQVGALFEGIAGTIITETTGSISSEPTMVYASNVTMKDKLSEYVDVRPGSEFRISVSYGNSEDPVLLPGGTEEPRVSGIIDADGNMSQAAYYYLDGDVTLTATYDKATKTFTLDFPDDYILDKRYSYSLKVTIEPNEKAYTDYLNSGETYPEGMIGDLKTDHMFAIEKTSEGQPGFFSNDTNLDNTNVTYTFKSDVNKEPFPKPVVQVHMIRSWEMYKTDDTGEKLGGAEFILKDLTEGSDVTYMGTSDYSKDGLVDWNLESNEIIALNKTYRLTESKAPFGYVGSKGTWILQLDSSNKPTLTVETPGVETAEYEVRENRNKNKITYILVFKNKKMIEAYNLPETGGRGIFGTTFAGIGMMLMAVFLFYKSKSKSKVYVK